MYQTILHQVRSAIDPIIHLTESFPSLQAPRASVSPRFFAASSPGAFPDRPIQKVPRKNYHDLARLVPISWF